MSLPTLGINLSQIGKNGGTLGYDFIVNILKDSGKFIISDHKDSISVVKGNRATILYFNGKKIYLDFWEYTAPTHMPQVVNANFDLIIKLQHKKITEDCYVSFLNCKKYLAEFTDEEKRVFFRKIVPWTFFPSKNMMPFIGKEDTLKSLPIEQIGFFCGRNWKARHGMKFKLDKEGVKYISAEVQGQRISDEDYMHLMLSSKYGFVLPGRSTHITDSKNRREIDYMMMRKPLLISYHPYYYEELVHGKHFILIDDKTDFRNLDKMYNMEEMVDNAFKWYENNAKPEGIVNSFLKIMTDKGYC